MAAPNLAPILQQQNAVNNNYSNQVAQNTFARNQAWSKGQQGLNDYTQQFHRQLPSFTAGFGRRGMSGAGIQSGVYQNAMNNFLGDYTKGLGRMQSDLYDQDQQYAFNQQRFAAERDNALADLAAQKAQLIASTAQHIAGLRPYLGG